jgi:hypothetical protein
MSPSVAEELYEAYKLFVILRFDKLRYDISALPVLKVPSFMINAVLPGIKIGSGCGSGVFSFLHEINVIVKERMKSTE